MRKENSHTSTHCYLPHTIPFSVKSIWLRPQLHILHLLIYFSSTYSPSNLFKTELLGTFNEEFLGNKIHIAPKRARN